MQATEAGTPSTALTEPFVSSTLARQYLFLSRLIDLPVCRAMVYPPRLETRCVFRSRLDVDVVAADFFNGVRRCDC